jgi:hypothetical protein
MKQDTAINQLSKLTIQPQKNETNLMPFDNDDPHFQRVKHLKGMW